MTQKLKENIEALRELREYPDEIDQESVELGLGAIDFCKWVASEVTNEELWKVNSESFAEIACRKLNKLGIVDKQGDSWVYKE